MRKRICVLLLISVFFLAGSWYVLNNRHAKIDEWSSSLIAEKIEWAEVSVEYGTQARRYVLSEEEYPMLLSLLRSVTEDNSSRKERSTRLEEGYRLVFFYDGKLWLFKCCEEEVVSLMFEDAETGAYYGCEGSLLYITCPELWHYIVDTGNEKAVP